jgi:predicted murein hydrolase (TIGR00659 family)
MSAWLQPEALGAAVLACLATLMAYILAQGLQRKAGNAVLLQPLLISSLVVGLALAGLGIGYAPYFDAAWPVHGLLGPATVALAVPLAGQLGRLRRLWLPVGAGLLAGNLAAAASALLLTRCLGGDRLLALSLAPKSTTTPIAMALSQRLGGDPSLTAVVVVLTGILGAALGPWVLTRMGVFDPAVRGLALGVSCHGIGTATAAQESEECGAWSGLAMGLSGVLTALLLPGLVRLLL